MTTIKFRAWDTDENRWYPHDRGEWINVCHDGSIVYGYEDGEVFEGEGRFEIMLSTGLHDKNGKEIWEGDILEHNNSLYPKGFKGWASKSVVRWNSKTASFDMGRYGEEEAGGGILTEVIGNIYEGDKNE